MTDDWGMKAHKDLEINLDKEQQCCRIRSMDTEIRIEFEDIGRLIYLLNLTLEELDANI